MLPSEAEGLPYQNPVQGAGTLLSYANCHTEGVEELHLTTYLSQAYSLIFASIHCLMALPQVLFVQPFRLVHYQLTLLMGRI